MASLLFLLYHKLFDCGASTLSRLRHLRRAPLDVGVYAPQKPVLLLALIDYVEQTGQTKNYFPIDERLYEFFNRNWLLLADGKPDSKVFRPLYHLQSDGLWQLINKEGRQQGAFIGSKSAMEKTIAYGRLDDDLFALMQSPGTRQIIRIDILEHFFPGKQAVYSAAHPHPYFDYLRETEAEVLLEPQAKYGRRTIEYQGYFRDTAFKKHVLRIYDHTCCMSGLRVFADVPMVEAAHISPFSHTGNNAVTNGLALCPNLHTAFDNGLISLDSHYGIIMRKGLHEKPGSLYPLAILEGHTIRLPENERYHPSQAFLKEHRRRFGVG